MPNGSGSVLRGDVFRLEVEARFRERPAWRRVPAGVEARFREDRPMKGIGAEAAYSDFLAVWGT